MDLVSPVEFSPVPQDLFAVMVRGLQRSSLGGLARASDAVRVVLAWVVRFHANEASFVEEASGAAS